MRSVRSRRSRRKPTSVRGQYGAGQIAGGQVPAYRTEPKVAADSQTKSYVGLKVLVDNWRWAEVPCYLRTGKRLPSCVTEIAIQFKRAPLALFRETSIKCMKPNWLVLRIQPREAISLQFEAKVPGPRVRLGTVKMDFCYADYFGQSPSNGIRDAAVRLHGRRHYALSPRRHRRSRMGNSSRPCSTRGRRVDPVSEYAAGSWGPADADALLSRDGRAGTTHSDDES